MKLHLSDIKVGTQVRIVELLENELKSKFLEMGLLSGKQISVEFKAPLGDPIAIEIDGSLLALRRDEARLLVVEKVLGE